MFSSGEWTPPSPQRMYTQTAWKHQPTGYDLDVSQTWEPYKISGIPDETWLLLVFLFGFPFLPKQSFPGRHSSGGHLPFSFFPKTIDHRPDRSTHPMTILSHWCWTNPGMFQIRRGQSDMIWNGWWNLPWQRAIRWNCITPATRSLSNQHQHPPTSTIKHQHN